MLRMSSLAAALCCLLTPALSSANHIDFIEDAPFMLNVDGMTGSASTAVNGSPDNILGGEREVLLIGGENGSSSAQTIPSGMSDDVRAITASAGTDQVSVLELRYDGMGAEGLGGLDFASQWKSIALEVSAVTGSWLVALEVGSGASIGSAVASVDSAGLIFFPFQDVGFTAIDFSSIDAVAAVFTALGPGAEMTIESITREAVIPEPSTSLLVSAGLLGLAVTRRVQRASSH